MALDSGESVTTTAFCGTCQSISVHVERNGTPVCPICSFPSRMNHPVFAGLHRAVLLTREYPPEVYGGAGVHVEYLARALARLIPIEVRCFGAPRGGDGPWPTGVRPQVRAYRPSIELDGAPYAPALEAISVGLSMAAGLDAASLVHSHTWYANMAGHLAKLIYGIPHVVTTHSLEPLRPWKAEQLGAGGYALSGFCERTALQGADAVIAVSAAMRKDILACYPEVDPERVKVIHDGIDPGEYRPDRNTDVLRRFGVDPRRPSVVFVGRVTRQKGINHLLEASLRFDPRAQLVLCAGRADTEELRREVLNQVERVRRQRGSVIWIEMANRREVIQLLSHATVFCCPSIYEPLGIVNLEAMACEAPVVATATGGIPEVVEEGSTGLLVPLGAKDEPGVFARHLAERVNALLADRARAHEMGKAGRRRVIERFSWISIAKKTLGLYCRVVSRRPMDGKTFAGSLADEVRL